MSCTSTVCNVPIGTVRVLGSETGTSSITLMEKLAIGSMSPGSPVSRTDAIVQVDTDDVLDVESGRDRVVVELSSSVKRYCPSAGWLSSTVKT